MLVNDNTWDLQEILPAAESLFPPSWIEKEQKKPKNDILLGHLNIVSTKKALHVIAQGTAPHQSIHPIAEAIVIGRAVLEQFQRTGQMITSRSQFLLRSLADVAKYRGRIGNIEQKIERLSSNEWKSALYEILVACSYAGISEIELIPETRTTTPDIRIKSQPEIYVECKAKIYFEQAVVEFQRKAREKVAAPLMNSLRNHIGSFVVRVEVKDDSVLAEIPAFVTEMVSKGHCAKKTPKVGISILPFYLEEIRFPEPVSTKNPVLWRNTLGFNEWDDWHVVVSGGNFEMVNLSGSYASGCKQLILVCLRSERLRNSKQNISQTIKSAYSQIRSHGQGIVRMLINADLYGIGASREIDNIRRDLEDIARNSLRQFSKLDGVRFDLVRGSSTEDGQVFLQEISEMRKAAHGSEDFIKAPGIVLL